MLASYSLRILNKFWAGGLVYRVYFEICPFFLEHILSYR